MYNLRERGRGLEWGGAGYSPWLASYTTCGSFHKKARRKVDFGFRKTCKTINTDQRPIEEQKGRSLISKSLTTTHNRPGWCSRAPSGARAKRTPARTDMPRAHGDVWKEGVVRKGGVRWGRGLEYSWHME